MYKAFFLLGLSFSSLQAMATSMDVLTNMGEQRLAEFLTLEGQQEAKVSSSSHIDLGDIEDMDYQARNLKLEALSHVFESGERESLVGFGEINSKHIKFRDLTQKVIEKLVPLYIKESSRQELEAGALSSSVDEGSLVRAQYRNRLESVLLNASELNPDIAAVALSLQGDASAGDFFASRQLASKGCVQKKILCNDLSSDDISALSVAQLEANPTWADAAFVATVENSDVVGELYSLSEIEKSLGFATRSTASDAKKDEKK